MNKITHTLTHTPGQPPQDLSPGAHQEGYKLQDTLLNEWWKLKKEFLKPNGKMKTCDIICTQKGQKLL